VEDRAGEDDVAGAECVVETAYDGTLCEIVSWVDQSEGKGGFLRTIAKVKNISKEGIQAIVLAEYSRSKFVW